MAAIGQSHSKELEDLGTDPKAMDMQKSMPNSRCLLRTNQNTDRSFSLRQQSARFPTECRLLSHLSCADCVSPVSQVSPAARYLSFLWCLVSVLVLLFVSSSVLLSVFGLFLVPFASLHALTLSLTGHSAQTAVSRAKIAFRPSVTASAMAKAPFCAHGATCEATVRRWWRAESTVRCAHDAQGSRLITLFFARETAVCALCTSQ